MNINPKVASAALAGSLTTVVVWCVASFSGVEIPPEVAAAFTVILSAGAGYMTSAKSAE